MKVDGNAIGLWDGVIHIFCNGKAKTVYLSANGTDEDKFITLNDCLKLIDYDEQKDGVCIVILERPLRGKVYQYGNYFPRCWVEHGDTKGFA